MRARIFMLVAVLCFGLSAMAKDIKTVVFTTNPEMHCANCENKIKGSLRFEKGVKDIVTDLKAKTVTVKYDADKTTVDNLVKGFAKINYKATVCKDAVAPSCGDGKKCDANTGKSGKECGKCDKKQKQDDCCKGKAGKGAEGSGKKTSEGGCCKGK